MGPKTHQIVGTSTGAVIGSMIGIICLGLHGGERGARGVKEGGKREIFKRSVEGVRGLIQHQQSYYNMVLEEVLNLEL